MVTLGFTGDVMLGRKVDEYQQSHPPERVWGDVLRRLQSLDGLCINLECCLSTRGQRWTRTHRPFHFRADPDWAIPALEAAGVDVVTLANNHMLDFGEVALRDTLEALDDAGVAHVGAGEDAASACEPAHVTVAGLEVAVVGFTDNTPEYAAESDSPGVARVEMDGIEADRETVAETIEAAQRREPDLLVASLHWGPNMVEYPDDQYRAFGRWLVGQGVDVVHGHSAHVFQGVERHDDGVVLYDTGDFVDDYAVRPSLRNDRSFLFELDVTPAGELEELRLHPVEIDFLAVQEADGETAAWCRERMRERSEPFGTSDAFERLGAGLRLAL